MEKKDLQIIRQYIDQHLGQAAEQLAEEHGIHIAAASRNITYDDRGCSIKVDVCDVVDGVAQTTEARDFAAHAHYWGLKPEHLGAEFEADLGKRFKLIGLKPRSPKFPLLAKSLADGKVYKFKGTVALKIDGNTYLDSVEGKQDFLDRWFAPAARARMQEEGGK